MNNGFMEQHLKTAELLARLMDNEFRLLRFGFGLDPLLGLFAGIGDILPLGISLYFLWIGSQLNLPPHKMSQIVINSVIDLLIGIIPFVGDIGDFAFKSHIKNLAILKEHYYRVPLQQSSP
jgi:hypothetical protein